MNIPRFTFCVSLAFAVFASGCTFLLHPINSTFARHSNPIEGWRLASANPDTAIETDYHDYIKKLSQKMRVSAGPVLFYEDSKGQHAVSIEISLNGTEWQHVLIYDQHDKRIKVIKYVKGYYMS